MDDPVPRLAGARLRAAARVLASQAVGAPLRRVLGALVIEKRLETIDFAAEGDPAPLYMPTPYHAREGKVK